MDYGRNRSWPLHLVVLLLILPLSYLSAQENEDIFISLKISDKPLSAALEKITKQTGFYFTFDSRLTDASRPVNMQLDQFPLQSAIDTLFERKDLAFQIINKNIVIYPAPKELPIPIDSIVIDEIQVREIKGKVRDYRTGKELPFATLVLMDTYIGTISNEDGSFLLRIPDTIRNPIITASFIGYKDQYTPISFNSDEEVEISMYKNLISLQEVIIRYQDPVLLLKEAINRVSDNYMNEEAGLQVYYRESVNKDEKCLIFSEAVFEIAKSSYSKDWAGDRLRLIRGRKLTNVNEQDTVIMKIRSGFNSMLKLDIIKQQPDFLLEDFNLRYNLHFSDVVSYNDQLVYVISFEQKEGIEDLLYQGELYLDRSSLAIVAADFRYDPARIQGEADLFIARKTKNIKVRPISAEYHVEYRKTAGKYFISQVHGSVAFKVRKRRHWMASKYNISLEMATTDAKPGNPPKIRLNEQLKASTVLSDEIFAYDPDFWGKYTIIMPELSLSEALEKVEDSLLEINQ